MTTNEKVLYEARDGVALITLDRPEVKNAIDPGMDQRPAEVWVTFRDDADVGVAVLTGVRGREVRSTTRALRLPHRRGGLSRLIAICGLGPALDLALSAEPIDAEEALRD
jgi:enoyl-CoA hydratase/carnithine racemase